MERLMLVVQGLQFENCCNKGNDRAIRAVWILKPHCCSVRQPIPNIHRKRGLLFLWLIYFSHPTFSLNSKQYVASSGKHFIPDTIYPERVYSVLFPFVLLYFYPVRLESKLWGILAQRGGKKAFLNKDFRVTVKKESHFHKAILVASGNVTLL